MRRALLAIALAAAALGGCEEEAPVSDRVEAESQVREAAADYDRAIVTADASALDAIMSDDYVYVTAEGEVRDKPTQIVNLTSGRFQVMSAGSEDVQIRWIGDHALLIGRFPARIRSDEGQFPINERYSSLWTRESGRWRLRHEHVSLIPQRP